MALPQPLIEDIEGRRCLPFIGAGFSLNAKLPPGREMPAWAGLTTLLAKTANVPSDLGGPAVASSFEKLFGRVQLIETVRKALHADYAEPGESHVAFAELPFDTIYTTNFDLLLKHTFQKLKKPFRSIVSELQMPFHGDRLTTSIVKMHGDLRHEEHVILTSEDYGRFLNEYPVIATHLAAQLITRTPLFIGYSLTDPDFKHIREIVRSRLGKFQRMAYVLAFDVDSNEINSKLEDHLHVISLPTGGGVTKDHLLALFFREIQERMDFEQGAKLRALRPDAFEELSVANLEKSSREKDAGALLTSSSNLCFVMMPFGDRFEAVYRTLINPVASQFGLTTVRADEMFSSGSIVEQIRVAIQQSRLCIADVSERNPNVLYEVGIAHTLGKPTILLTQNIEELPFDLKNLRTITYQPSDLERTRIGLSKFMEAALGGDRVEEARRLIAGGMYRAAAALLGVVMEHDLRRLIDMNSSAIKVRIGRRPLASGQAVRLLHEGGLLASEDVVLLERALEVRNRAVHHLEDPSRDEVRMLLDAVLTFRGRYLGNQNMNP